MLLICGVCVCVCVCVCSSVHLICGVCVCVCVRECGVANCNIGIVFLCAPHLWCVCAWEFGLVVRMTIVDGVPLCTFSWCVYVFVCVCVFGIVL